MLFSLLANSLPASALAFGSSPACSALSGMSSPSASSASPFVLRMRRPTGSLKTVFIVNATFLTTPGGTAASVTKVSFFCSQMTWPSFGR